MPTEFRVHQSPHAIGNGGPDYYIRAYESSDGAPLPDFAYSLMAKARYDGEVRPDRDKCILRGTLESLIRHCESKATGAGYFPCDYFSIIL